MIEDVYQDAIPADAITAHVLEIADEMRIEESIAMGSLAQLGRLLIKLEEFGIEFGES